MKLLYFVVFILISNLSKANRKNFIDNCKSTSAASNRKFAFEFYQHIAEDHPVGNVFVAPLAVSMGLNLILMGAGRNTRTELEAALDIANTTVDGNILECINSKYDAKAQPLLTKAVKLYRGRTVKLRNEFLSQINNNTENVLEEVDFSQNPDASRNLINRWVEQNTAGKIDQLFPPGSISSDIKLALVSAVYFKGEWRDSFDVVQKPFFISESESVSAQFLCGTALNLIYHYDVTTNLHFLELPYKHQAGDVEVSMILVLDVTNDGFEEAESKLTLPKLNNAISRLLVSESTELDISLPIFNISKSYELRASLQSMGINRLFNAEADFSRMTNDDHGLYLSDVRHEAFLSVTKDGSEAAGAGGFGFSLLSLRGALHFNKPFHLIIYEKTRGNVLFMGRIVNPIAS